LRVQGNKVAGADPFGICPRKLVYAAEAEPFSVAGAGDVSDSPGSTRGIVVTAFAILAAS
jgi:hypothetical protein